MDFLARLGGSALGLTASVTPIIAPLFLATPSTLRDAAPGAATVDRDQAPRPLDEAERERPLVQARELHEAPSMRAPEPTQRTDSSRRTEPATAEVRVPAVSDLIAPTPHRALSDPLAGRVSMRDAGLVGAPIAPARAPIETTPRDLAEPSGNVAPPGEWARPEPLVIREPPHQQPLDVTATLLHRLRSLRESAPAPASARSPVVRVTIGRIEVRSASVPAPAPAVDVVRPPAPAFTQPPRLTLEQYLRRNRGER